MNPNAQPSAEPPNSLADGAAAAEYIAAMVKGLSSIAQNHGLDTLSYLLDMAGLEAEQRRIVG